MIDYTELLQNLVAEHHMMSVYKGCTDGSEERVDYHYAENKKQFDELIKDERWILQFYKEDGTLVTFEGTGSNESLNKLVNDENNHTYQFHKFIVNEMTIEELKELKEFKKNALRYFGYRYKLLNGEKLTKNKRNGTITILMK